MMTNPQWLKNSISLLELKKKLVVKSIITIIPYLIGKFSCQNGDIMFKYFDLIYFLIMYILISAMINQATKDLNKDTKK
jgi:hypothetical protein